MAAPRRLLAPLSFHEGILFVITFTRRIYSSSAHVFSLDSVLPLFSLLQSEALHPLHDKLSCNMLLFGLFVLSGRSVMCYAVI